MRERLSDDLRQARRERRDAWCAERRPGDPRATFYAGEELRCPGTIRHPSGARQPCGESLEEWVKPGQKVLVRVRTNLHGEVGVPGTNAVCSNVKCRSALEIFAILEATG